MRKVTFKELSLDDFKIYGTYANMLEPEGIKIGKEPIEFFRDMLQQELGSSNTVSFSLCRVKRRPYIIDCTEYHNHCCEAIMPIDGDILMHVGPAVPEGEVLADKIEVFRVPKGTVVNIRPGVWHQAAFPYNCESVNILCLLPERTYANDCHLVELKEQDKIEIVFN